MAIAAWNITKEHNVGSLVRTAHAVAAEEVVLVGEREWNVEAARTAELYTKVAQLSDAAAFRRYREEKEWTWWRSSSTHGRSIFLKPSIHRAPASSSAPRLAASRPTCSTRRKVIVQIPQWGLVPSLNLAVAGSIVLYDFLAKLDRDGRLDRPDGGLARSSHRVS